MTNKNRTKELKFAIASSDREIKIDAILRYAGDEFESIDDYIRLAKMTDNELNDDMQNLIEYYKNL